MDSPRDEDVWRELLALRARVERLERGAVAVPVEAPRGAELSFVQPERPSLESRIGSQWFNRVGIIALLIGAAWFLKYAVDREWLGPALRVWVGLFAGFGLIGWSERFRRRGFPVFSFSLKAAGTGVLYLSLWAAYSLFHLIPFAVACVGMVLVTVGNVALCAFQQSEALAAVAMVGGFLTPALLGVSPESVWALGSYLLLLNGGFAALLLRFSWGRLLPGAFVGTQAYLLVLAWRGTAGVGQSGAALLFALLFFVGFSLVAALAGSTRDRAAAASWVTVAVTIANALLGTLELWRLAPDTRLERYAPVVTALWFAGLLFVPYTRALRDVLAGLVASLAAVGVWAVCSGGGVVLGWGLEAAVLLLLPSRRGVSGFAASPLPGAGLLGLGSLWLVGLAAFGSLREQALVLLNVRTALFGLLVGVSVLGVRIGAGLSGRVAAQLPAFGVGRDLGPGNALFAAQWRRAAAGAALIGSVLVLLAGVFEIHNYWQGQAPERFWDSAWAGLVGLGLLLLGFGARWAWLRWQGLGLLLLAIGKVFLVDLRKLSQGFGILSFLGLGVLLLLVSFIYQRDLLKLRGREHEE